PPRRRLTTLRPHWRLLGAACALALTCCAGGPGRWWGMGHPAAAAAAAEPADEPGVAGSYLAGLAAIDEGDLKRAADELTTALRAAPDDLALQGQVFELLLASGEFERAVAGARALQARGAVPDEAKL